MDEIFLAQNDKKNNFYVTKTIIKIERQRNCFAAQEFATRLSLFGIFVYQNYGEVAVIQ